jgi:formylglycine-generating enzyme required for sulfatase activity
MKKLFFICLASIMVCVSLNAQIENTGEKESYSIETLEDVPNNSDTCLDQHPSPIFKDPILDTFILVKGGTFQMGSKEDGPIHTVTLCDYYIGQTEVTQAQWRMVMGDNPSSFNGIDACPVWEASWENVQTFITKLNNRSGGSRFRLPTEAEWEYAARGGKQSKEYRYSGSNNIDAVAWYIKNSENKTHPVKGRTANELGLYDMSGNVWEWCSDWSQKYSSISQKNPTGATTGSHRVLRGGGILSNLDDCVVTFRSYNWPEDRILLLGFRLAKEVTFYLFTLSIFTF